MVWMPPTSTAQRSPSASSGGVDEIRFADPPICGSWRGRSTGAEVRPGQFAMLNIEGKTCGGRTPWPTRPPNRTAGVHDPSSFRAGSSPPPWTGWRPAIVWWSTVPRVVLDPDHDGRS